MKTIWLLPLLLFTAACVPNDSIRDQPGVAESSSTPVSPFPDPAISAPAPAPDMGVHIVQPATGGTPIFGIPLGGNIFMPVTGGPPVFGIPLGP